MTRVDLVYSEGCPNVPEARVEILNAFAAAGVAPAWREWERDDPATPEELRGYGSPSVLVDGADVSPAESPCAAACRIYADEDHIARAPRRRDIAAALRRARAPFPVQIEIFSTGPSCPDILDLLNRIAVPSAEIRVLDMTQPDIAARAEALGIRSVPAVLVDGQLRAT